MAILDTRNVTAEQTSALFDVTLGEFLFFAQGAKTITYNHAGIIPYRYVLSKYKLAITRLQSLRYPENIRELIV
jgi:hypothetical protein